MARTGEQGEALVEPLLELREREHVEPRGRELDGQGDAVEAAADASDGGEVAVAWAEIGPYQHRAVEEKPNRLCFVASRGSGQVEGLHREQRLARDADRCLARVQHLHLGTRLQQPSREIGDLRDEVLTVVEHEEELLVPEALAQSVGHGAPGLFLHAQHGGDSARDRAARRQVGKLDEPRAVPVTAGSSGCGFDGDARLAASARADDRHEPPRLEHLVDGFEHLHAPDECRDGTGKVVLLLADRAQRGEVGAQPVERELEDRHGPGYVSKLMAPEIDEREPAGRDRRIVARPRRRARPGPRAPLPSSARTG